LESNYKFSPRTKKSYRLIVKNTDLENLERYILKLHNKLANKTFNLHISALRHFNKFLEKQYPGNELIERINDLERTKVTNVNSHKPYSAEEVQKILSTVKGWRKSALSIALYAGLRQSEIALLNYDDVDLNDGHIIVREGKGKKSRNVAISSFLIKELEKWKQFYDLNINSIKKDNIGQPFLFSRQGSRPVISSGNVLKGLSDELGFKVNWHRCRATFATHLYQKTKDVKLVQYQLGHSNSSTTDIYIQHSLQEIKNQITKIGDIYEK
jgi:integrase